MLPTHALILAFLLQLFALLRLRNPALLARLVLYRLPLYRPAGARFWQGRSWHAQSWGQSPTDAGARPSRLARYLVRILYVLGPRPRRGMRPLPNRTPIRRPTPPIRPPPREKPRHREPPKHDSVVTITKHLNIPLAPPAPSHQLSDPRPC